jgi:hypothetical protein
VFSLGDVFRERHHKPRHALGARNEGDVVAHPDRGAVLASVLLLDLKLCSPSFEQLGGELPIRFAIVLVSEFQEGEFADFLFGVPQHSLIAALVARKRPLMSVSATPMAEFSNTDRHRSSLL